MKKGKKLLGTLLAASMLASSFGMLTASAADLYNPPIAEVEQGQLRGYMDGSTYTFLGVPYATVSERFAMPEEVAPWEGVRDAQSYGATCPIPEQTSVGADEMVWPHRYWIQNENCQFVNIWTQSLDSTAKKPVMVFMHGGGHTNGSSIEAVAYEGANLSEYGDVVVVTLNHRLNALGYLNLSAYGDEYKYSGNAGTADLIAALEWINANIESFGGDPDNVTIFGQSGGGGKVLTMLHTEAAEGLVDKVVAHSGNLNPLTVEESQLIAAKTLEVLGLDETQVDELKTIPYDELITAGTEACTLASEELGKSVKWGPTADEDFVFADYCEWSSEIPLMNGTVLTEQTSTFKIGDGRKNEWTEEETMANLTELYGEEAEAIAEEFAKAFPDRPLADAYFYGASHRINAMNTLEGKIASGTAPVYNFLFSYEAPVNGGTSAFHCADLIYVFHNVEIPILTRATGGNEDALRIQDQMATAWVNFAKTGNPSQEGLEWTPYTSEEHYTMVFDIESGCRIIGDETLADLIVN